MIGKAIGKPGEPGTGGGRNAFVPGVIYVCAKAVRIELLNLTSPKWQDAGAEMELTSELSAKVEKPFYHLVLTWHPDERPTPDQQVAAMVYVLASLGLEDHQIVIGTHVDRGHAHVHAVVNRVHPTTGKVWSKSNDHAKIEKACRELELRYGWKHDNGRFDFDVTEGDGHPTVKLKPNREAWQEKKRVRKEGRLKPSPGDIAFERHHGVKSFNLDIPPALQDRVAAIISGAQNWTDLHYGLADIGLEYRAFGSGARIHLLCSEEFAKASMFGQDSSLKRLEARLGRYQPPESGRRPATDAMPEPIYSITGIIADNDQKRSDAQGFKLTLLRRSYVGLFLDEEVAERLHRVRMDEIPPYFTFKNGATVKDHGGRITASAVTPDTVKATVALAQAKGWSAIIPRGPENWIQEIALEAARVGIPVVGVPDHIKKMADELLEKTREAQRAAAAQVALESAETSASAEVATIGAEEVMDEPARRAAEEIFGGDLSDEHPSQTPKLPADAVREPVPSPARGESKPNSGKNGTRPSLENDPIELEEMQRLDIGVIADLGGWQDVSRTHPDSSDRHGKRFRIYQRGGDTIKPSLKDGKWLWTSNKTGAAGGVIDLWLADNPGKNLGHARQAFRDLRGMAPPSPRQAREPLAPVVDMTEVRRRWRAALHVDLSVPNYAVQRGISPSILIRFADQLRSGAYGGIYFAHRDLATGEVTGFEQRWETDGQPNRARFSKGGQKTVSVLGDPQTATRMVVVEGGLDALALAELEDRNDTIYVTTAGGFGSLTERAIAQLSRGRTVISGFDNDEAGEKLHVVLNRIVPDSLRDAPPKVVDGIDAPRKCKDWLDVLVASRLGVLETDASVIDKDHDSAELA